MRTVTVAFALLALVGTSACQPFPILLPGLEGSGTPTHDVPASVDPSGGRDVTASLQQVLDETPDGATLRFPAGARYRIEGTLQLHDRNGITLDGNGAELFATTRGDRTRSQLVARGGGQLTVRDLVITGANPEAGVGETAYQSQLEAQHGIELLGVRGALLENLVITEVYGDFVYLGAFDRRVSGHQRSYEWTSDVILRHSTLDRNGRQGIAITAAERVLIGENRIFRTRRATFDIEPNSVRGGARSVRITNNTIGRGRLNLVSIGGRGGQVSDIEISGNIVRRPFNVVARATDQSTRRDYVISGNTSLYGYGSSQAGIILHHIEGAVIENNDLMFAPRRNMRAVELRRSCGVLVAGNNFAHAAIEVDGHNPPCTG